MPYYYAVAKGRRQGVYNSWDECKVQVDKYSAPVFKKFSSRSEAESFIQQRGDQSSSLSRQDTYQSSSSYQGTYPKYSAAPKQTSRAETRSYLASSNEYDYVPSNFNEQAQSSSILKKYLSTDASNLSSSGRRTKLYEMDSNKADSADFNVDSEGYVSVFTDGACSSNGGKGAKAGLGVWFGDSHPLNVSKPVTGRQTNNAAEIRAVIEAAKQANRAGVKKLKINTDSEFIIKCTSQWMDKWKRTGWQTANGKNVINKDELVEMENALAPFEDVTWNHVPGHAGIHGNEMADKLARAGATQKD